MVTMVLLKVAWICTMPVWTMRFSFFLKLFFLPPFAGAFAMLGLRARFLLVGDSSAARSFARAGVGVRALAAHRQTAAVAHSTVGTHLDVPLDVHRDFLAEIALHRAFLFQYLADAVDFVFGQVAHLPVEVDTGAVEHRARPGPADSVDVGESDLGPLGGRQIHTSNTCHVVSPASVYVSG